jgi:hypothetical protein
MNAAIPVEEAYTILTDEKQNGHLVLLDAKAALSFRKPSLRWILHIMNKWLYSISDHCFDDLTNYRQNCYSSIVDGIESCIRQCYTFTSVPAYVPRGNSGQNVDYY